MEGDSSDMEIEWIGDFLGTYEAKIIWQHRADVFKAGEFVHMKDSSKRWLAGRFEYPRVAELHDRLVKMSKLEIAKRKRNARQCPPLRVIDGIDIGELQGTLKTEDRAMVQIASNFNCLEVPSRDCKPEYGFLVENYVNDSTQGPAASFGVPAASLLRCHYCFYDPAQDPLTWGQTHLRQVELLSDVRQFFGTCVNGKVTLDGTEEPLNEENVNNVASNIRIGIHEDAEVVYSRKGRGSFLVLSDPQKVDQVLSASVNWNSPGEIPAQQPLECLTRAALRACYNGAYIAAITRRRKMLLLTLVGGGVFSNPEDMILQELARAHARWAGHPASCLEDVRLCLYPRGTAGPTDEKLKRIISACGSPRSYKT